MNTADGKGVGIYQAIPMDVMVACLRHILNNGTISQNDLRALLAQYPRGTNRLDKIREHASKIFIGMKEESVKLTKFFPSTISAYLTTHEIKMIAIAISALAYPAFYKLLVLVAQQFKVQPVVSRTFINLQMGNIYGGSRSSAHAVDAILPMLVEAGLIQRSSNGLYEKAIKEPVNLSQSVCEYWIRVDLLLSGNRALSSEEIIHRPWNDFCPGVENVIENLKMLKLERMSGGQSYVKL